MAQRWGSEQEPVGFWTILFAVAGGVLLADLVRLLFAALAAGAVLSSLSASIQHTATPRRAPLHPDVVVDAQPIEALPGPVEARANAISRACIAGFVANRSGAGWDQQRPLARCSSTSE